MHPHLTAGAQPPVDVQSRKEPAAHPGISVHPGEAHLGTESFWLEVSASPHRRAPLGLTSLSPCSYSHGGDCGQHFLT
ncbi:hypothetical protein R6Z07F_004751 [Ovis aries]